jgi:hypothetical protein
MVDPINPWMLPPAWDWFFLCAQSHTAIAELLWPLLSTCAHGAVSGGRPIQNCIMLLREILQL